MPGRRAGQGRIDAVQIAVLGPLEVRADAGQPVEVGGARLRRLLILLALEPGRVVTTSRLVDGVWEDDRPAGAANALQALVSRLRRAIPEIVLESRPAGYRLVVEPDAVDARRFERLAAAGRARLPVDPAGAAATLREALALWRGPALADVADADFARARVARLTELRLTAIEDRVEADLRLGAGPSLVPELQELVAAHPLREPPIGQLMRALRAAGRPSAALSVFEQARGRLADQLGADPSPGLTTLHMAVLRGEPDSAHPDPRRRPDGAAGPAGSLPAPGAAQPGAAGRTTTGPSTTGPSTTGPGAQGPTTNGAGPDRGRTNLRTELTSFVGRDADAERIGALLAASRLVTLTGPGGSGKTRLAIEAARPLLARAPDGVWLVELAPVSDPAEVPQGVLTVLGLREHALIGTARIRSPTEQATDPSARLAAGLAGKDLLLVLDNCEHLVEGAAALAGRILGDCPGVRILATSREPLGIMGETLWPVPPLALPPAGADTPAALGYASVQLLAERAAAVRPGFAVDAGNVAAVVQTCRALDGMPLAIELAAARLRSMTPEQVAARLDDRFRLLTGGNRTALPRHRTLQAVVDWSWDLLDGAEQALWRRLAVFAGGATAEAAERVAAGGPVAPDRVADLLTALVDKSLLAPTGSAEPRYRMLETIRAYGLDRLAEAGERDRLRAAHAAYFRDLAEAAEPLLQTRDQLYYLGRLADEHDNLHAALRNAIAAGDAATAVRLVAALGWYWWLRGHRAEGAELTREALELPGEAPPASRALAYGWGAMNAFGSGHEPAAASDWLRAATEATAAAKAAGSAGTAADPAARHPMLRLLGPFQALMATSDQDRALGLLRELYDDEDPWLAAIARVMHAAVAVNLGRRYTEAEADLLVALDTFRQVGERWGLSLTFGVLSQLTGLGGDHARAAGYLQESLALAAELGAEEDVPQLGAALVHELWMSGQTGRAAEALAEACRRAERAGLPESLAAVYYTAGELARRTGDPDTARDHLRQAAAAAAAPGVARQWRAGIAGALGWLDLAAGDLDAARATLTEALQTALASVDAPIIAQILVAVADLAVCSGDPARAAALLGATESILGLPEPSLLDLPRVAAAARKALGERAFTEAYQSGRGTTMQTVQGLAGLTPDA